MGLLHVPEGCACKYLNALGITLESVREEVLNMLGSGWVKSKEDYSFVEPLVQRFMAEIAKDDPPIIDVATMRRWFGEVAKYTIGRPTFTVTAPPQEMSYGKNQVDIAALTERVAALEKLLGPIERQAAGTSG